MPTNSFKVKDPFGSNNTFVLPDVIFPLGKEVSVTKDFLVEATRFTANLFCPDVSESTIFLTSEISTMIKSFTKFKSPRDKKEFIDVIFATFKTPELSYDELDGMGENPKLEVPPGLGYVTIIRKFHIKYWNIAANQILKILEEYVDNNKMYDKYTLILTGHGGGAVLATFAAMIFNNFWPEREVILITYGAPRIGNKYFVKYIQERIWVERVTVNDDYAPLFFGNNNYFTHTSMETWIVPNKSCDCWSRNEDQQIEVYKGKDSFHRCTSPIGTENKVL
ncbi:hypothetical protein G9A89_020696 [Geosiphon pyriformis]|nr:hypothetical protein G9A89_020696 [Geosiphon pyriformis]